jgi:hypothetical protein
VAKLPAPLKDWPGGGKSEKKDETNTMGYETHDEVLKNTGNPQNPER